MGVVVALAGVCAVAPTSSSASTGFPLDVGQPTRSDGPISISTSLPEGISELEAVADLDNNGFDETDPVDRVSGGGQPTLTTDLFGSQFLWQYGAAARVRIRATDTTGAQREAVVDVEARRSQPPASGTRGGKGVVTQRTVAGLRLGSASEETVIRSAGTPTRSNTDIEANFFKDAFRVLGYGTCRTQDPYTCSTVFVLRLLNMGGPGREQASLIGFSTASTAYRTPQSTRRGVSLASMQRRERGERLDPCLGVWRVGAIRIGATSRRVTGLALVRGTHVPLYFAC